MTDAEAMTATAGTAKPLWDARTRECALSAAVMLSAVGAVLVIAAALGLASERLLKLGCVNVIAGVGLGLFSGGVGILSLGHIAFFGVGAYVSAWFTLPVALKSILLPDMPAFILEAEWPLVAALAPAVGAALLVGAVTGLAIQRLRDTSAVIASFGFLVIFYLLFIGLKPLTNGKQSLYGVPIDQAGWPLVFGATAAAMAAAYLVKASALGRNAEALRDDEQAARSIGVKPAPAIYLLWVISAGFLGLAGALFTHILGVASPNTYYLDKTFALIVLIIVGGYRSLTGCVVGAVVITVAEEIFKKTEEALAGMAGQEALFGLVTMPRVFGLTALAFSAMILIVLYLRPEGVAGYREIASAGPLRRIFAGFLDASREGAERASYAAPEGETLAARGLRKSYGAFVAMEGVDLEARTGEIVGLIGPNGAGKSTFINVMTGNLYATGGTITLAGADATLWSAERLAREGLGRTFQNIRVFPSLTALENVLVAVNVARPDLTRAAAEAKAMAWLRTLGVEGRADELAGALAYGDQRRLEIARALALEPHFLLLDEPAAGMNNAETEALRALLREIVDRIGCGVILVEHDMPMVMGLCDRIVVLNKGEQIASGPAAEVRRDPAVIEAYIGEETD